jgi:hypothetical protein
MPGGFISRLKILVAALFGSTESPFLAVKTEAKSLQMSKEIKEA